MTAAVERPSLTPTAAEPSPTLAALLLTAANEALLLCKGWRAAHSSKFKRTRKQF
ncbi:hypothetical protein COCSUDRAFT_53093 [Coccomyxa subellipsoidea C-169]|uniref:Uncharacterized protein n=1 Tax=Coccomyxa subellipsoidea (strain C-169) TaxID=574566 RepID=I0Z2H2_COCSC|nr:hypothetical protein COCSUDRAFT_53093 [Coccomyxa subellipsoidea C-169]EIE24841.1 hypothetical protein COCSUDRAFT_53093 [Coccomyxa subellipsoidea C-169]|eukprot:XP_005649385.1 hypothetical protein COCSUDRAFT_53093 [Coccomyxa subellipsoidea C-169]